MFQKNDITFCSNEACDHFDCERNMVNVDPDDPGAMYLSIAMLQDTELCPLYNRKKTDQKKYKEKTLKKI